MAQYITEILEQINKDPNLLKTTYRNNYAVVTLLEYAFDKNKKFVLPEGTPPFKPDAAPLGMSPANFYQQIKKLYVFCRKDLSAVRREQLFIQMIEGLHPSEAEICVLIKDQNLTSKYENITADLVEEAGIVQKENIFRPAAKEGTHHVVTLSETAQTKESFGNAPKEVVTEEPPKKTRGRPKKTA